MNAIESTIHKIKKMLAETPFSFMLFNELSRFLSEIETDNFTVSNSEIITFDFTVLKNSNFMK